MTPAELDRIEGELGIGLPETYRRAVDPYPIPALCGNTEWMFWDDADALIALNNELREGGRTRSPWPPRFYALGQDGGGCSDAIDLDDPEHGVFWFDRQHIDVSDGDRSDEKLSAWIARQIVDSTRDLEDGGIDPSGTPEERALIQERNSKDACLPLFLLVAGVIAISILVWMFAMRM